MTITSGHMDIFVCIQNNRNRWNPYRSSLLVAAKICKFVKNVALRDEGDDNSLLSDEHR